MSKAIRNMEVMVRSMKRAKEEGMSTDNCHASMYNDNLLVRHNGTLEGQRLTIERNYGSTDIVQVWYDSVNEVKHVCKVDVATTLIYYPLLSKLEKMAKVTGLKDMIVSNEYGNGFYSADCPHGEVIIDVKWEYKTLPAVVWNALGLNQSEGAVIRPRDSDVVLTDTFSVGLKYEVEEPNAWTKKAVLKEASLEFQTENATFETWYSWKEDSVEA